MLREEEGLAAADPATFEEPRDVGDEETGAAGSSGARVAASGGSGRRPRKKAAAAEEEEGGAVTARTAATNTTALDRTPTAAAAERTMESVHLVRTACHSSYGSCRSAMSSWLSPAPAGKPSEAQAVPAGRPKSISARRPTFAPRLRARFALKALREGDLANVCAWHGIEIRSQRKAHIDRLREIRNHVRDFGPLELLLSARAQPSAADTVLFANLQLLLQTSNASGGSASRSALALNTIAVAVALCRDRDLDIDACCIGHGICPVGHQTQLRVTAVRDRILELGLLELPRILSKVIDRTLVEEVRSRHKVSISAAAHLVLRHGRNVEAACAELAKQLGVDGNGASGGGSEGGEVVAEAEGYRLYLSDRSATGYMGVHKSGSGKFFEARCAAKKPKRGGGGAGGGRLAVVARKHAARHVRYGYCGGGGVREASR